MRLQYIFHGKENKQHPFYVKSTWEPPVQQSVALETFLEEVKLWILLFGRYSLQLDNNIHYLIIFHVKTVTRMARLWLAWLAWLALWLAWLAGSHISTTPFKPLYCCNTTTNTNFLALKYQIPCAVNLLHYILVLYMYVLRKAELFFALKEPIHNGH